MRHTSHCAIYNEPALPNGPCNCGAVRYVTVRSAWMMPFVIIKEALCFPTRTTVILRP